jgi:hypothetical protein
MRLLAVQQQLTWLYEILTLCLTLCSVLTANLQLRKTCPLSWKYIIGCSIMALRKLHERIIRITDLY